MAQQRVVARPTFADLDTWLRDFEDDAVGMAGLAPDDAEATALRNQARVRAAVFRQILRTHFAGNEVPTFILNVEQES